MKTEISNIINQLKNGSSKEKENAFKILVNKYKQRLYWHIRKIVIDHDDANDVIQNTFMKVYLKIKTFNEKSKIFTWMYRIATNESINFDTISYKDVNILTNYLSEQGKILPRRVTGLTSKQQKKVTKLIKTARIAALLPFVIGKG